MTDPIGGFSKETMEALNEMLAKRTQERIKMLCETLYERIENSQKQLAEIRKSCKHPSTFEGKYSWKIGVIQDAIICSDCAELIRYK